MYISIKSAVKRYGEKTVLHGINLEIERGQFVALLGPSGCGKTTLLNALSGLVDLDDGEIVIDDRVLSSKGFTVPPEKRNVGMVFQDFALWPHMNVYDNVAFGLRVRKNARAAIRERVHEVLKVVRMNGFEDHFPHQLSGGQKQRIAIARALAPSPKVLLLDEPLSSLDAKLREEMRWELLSIISQANITAVYVTHDQIEALSMADQIVLLNQGQIEQQGSPTDLYKRPKTEFAAWFLGASNRFEGTVVDRHDDLVKINCGDVVLSARSREADSTHLVAMIRSSDIEVLDPSDTMSSDVAGTFFTALVQQRAFHGVNWQYRLELDGPLHLRCEAAAVKAYERGAHVCLFIPTESCHVVPKSSSSR